jgi:hypothetical protein
LEDFEQLLSNKKENIDVVNVLKACVWHYNDITPNDVFEWLKGVFCIFGWLILFSFWFIFLYFRWKSGKLFALRSISNGMST